MKRKPGMLRRLLSLNQHRKRLGAARHAERDSDISAMKTRLIELGAPMQPGDRRSRSICISIISGASSRAGPNSFTTTLAS